ncbi:MAG: alpha-1,3-galactosidase, partial [Bacteroidales bacterium]|nr:alpha-1,3-galactosidase [Bacteroidales bacterium]
VGTSTRGVLVSTRRRVLIEGNTFFRMQMSGILIADDARSWFESGMVRDVSISGNEFVECGSPVIMIAPENDVNDGCVHRNVSIAGNRFLLSGGKAVYARSVDGLEIVGNLFVCPDSRCFSGLTEIKDCLNVKSEGNEMSVAR